MRLARERNGSLDVARVMKTTEATGTGKDERTWTLALGKFVVERASIDVEDRVPDPGVKLAIRDLDAHRDQLLERPRREVDDVSPRARG